jgi:class 3 adenylate cyclase
MMAVLYMVQAFALRAKTLLAILINILRTLLFPVIYVLSEYGHEFSGTPGLAGFFTYWNSSSGHTFILLAALLFGLLLGLAESQIDRYTDFLRRVASRLKEVSEWALESSLLEESVDDSTVLNQRRTERAVLFLDIRGFTAWSETRDPETVIGMLNQFYEIAESTITEGGGHKPHFIGDEVMTWFDNPYASVEVARQLCREVNQRLQPYGLASGGGLHLGDVVEGLMGSSGTRGYNIIGDTVNTTARLCAAAQPGEVLISQALADRTALLAELKEPREIRAKGKQATLTVYPLH